MTYSDTELHHNDWLSLWCLRDPEHGVGGYVYSRETRCGGHIVAALPYDRTDAGLRFLLRVEVTPCWSMEPIQSAVTGGMEMGESFDETMLRELREETGFAVPQGQLAGLGTCRGTKSTDTVYHLYAVDVTGFPQGLLTGDGSALEDSASVLWTNTPWLSPDPLVSVMWARLMEHRGEIG